MPNDSRAPLRRMDRPPGPPMRWPPSRRHCAAGVSGGGHTAREPRRMAIRCGSSRPTVDTRRSHANMGRCAPNSAPGADPWRGPRLCRERARTHHDAHDRARGPGLPRVPTDRRLRRAPARAARRQPGSLIHAAAWGAAAFFVGCSITHLAIALQSAENHMALSHGTMLLGHVSRTSRRSSGAPSSSGSPPDGSTSAWPPRRSRRESRRRRSASVPRSSAPDRHGPDLAAARSRGPTAAGEPGAVRDARQHAQPAPGPHGHVAHHRPMPRSSPRPRSSHPRTAPTSRPRSATCTPTATRCGSPCRPPWCAPRTACPSTALPRCAT